MFRLAGSTGLAAAVLLAHWVPAIAQTPASKKQANAAPKASSTAEGILEKMTKAYAEAKTYEDQGELIEVSQVGSEPVAARALFASKFAQPDSWIFEGEQQIGEGGPSNRFLAWSTGKAKESFSQVQDQAPVKSSSTRFSLGLINGVFTSPISALAPSLLGEADKLIIPDILKPERRWKLAGSEKIGTAECDRLVGVKGLDDEVDIRLWVDRKTSLIRRYQEVATRAPIRFENTINLQPKINEPIDAAAFDPQASPAKAGQKSPTIKKSAKARKKN